MLNPLNIAPASGQTTNQITGQKPDPLTSPKSDTAEAKRGDKTFESVLADESEPPHTPEETKTPDAQTDVDSGFDPDEAGTDEMADFPILTDHAVPPPDADETFGLSDANKGSQPQLDEGGLIARQYPSQPNEFASSDTQAGREGGRIFTQIPGQNDTPDRALNDKVILTSGNADPLRATAQPPQLLKGQTPGASTQPVLTDEITADLPQISTGARGAIEDNSPPTGGRAVHSLLGVALGQQASAAKLGQNEAQKKPPVDTLAMQADTDQALPEKAVEDLSKSVSYPPTGQTGLALQALAKGDRTYKDLDKTTARQKDNTRESGLNLAGRNGQIQPAPTGVITATAAGPTPATFAEFQMDTGRVNWVSETGVLADTGARAGLPAPVTTSINQAFHHPDLPRHLAAQIASVAQRGEAGKPVELLLNPSELGRVKISMASIDGRMSVSVIADRPETLDLMRRHIDVLAQEFLDIGYGQADFAFGQNSQQNGADSAPYHPDNNPQISGLADEKTPETPPLATAAIAARLITDRVDIRL